MANHSMPQMRLPVQILPTIQSGVYFLCYQGEIVYVGQSSNIRKRIASHIIEGAKSFDAVSCLPCSGYRVELYERHFIAKLMPKYNKCGLAVTAKKVASAGWDGSPDDLVPCKNVLLTVPEAAIFLGWTEKQVEELELQGVKHHRHRSRKVGWLRAYAFEDLLQFVTHQTV